MNFQVHRLLVKAKKIPISANRNQSTVDIVSGKTMLRPIPPRKQKVAEGGTGGRYRREVQEGVQSAEKSASFRGTKVIPWSGNKRFSLQGQETLNYCSAAWLALQMQQSMREDDKLNFTDMPPSLPVLRTCRSKVGYLALVFNERRIH